MNAIMEAAPVLTAAAMTASPHRLAEHVDIADHRVRIDVYEPPVGGGAHTVLLLHGTAGLLGDGALLRRAARHLAARDFRACVVHYFNATGTFFATHTNACAHAAEWRDALAAIARQYAATTGEPVGLFGYSLGGFLAVRASQGHADVGAIAVLASGLLEEPADTNPASLPPLLVLHGGQDARIPVDRADALVRFGRRAGTIVESVVYPGEGHALGATAERDAFARAAEFFAARLGAGADA